VDFSGAAYITGLTNSSDFPTTPGAYDSTHNGGYYGDVFVVKLSPSGTTLAYATFLGGSSDEWGEDIAVDTSGAAYVTGYTGSSNFPTTPGAYDTTFNSGFDAFVVKLNSSGTALAYATFLGGSSDEWGEDIAVDTSGAAYVTGYTMSSNFPTTPGAFDTTFNGYSDAFVAKLNPSGSALAYGTFLGGDSSDNGDSIAVDTSGAAYVTGYTMSSNFPTTPGAYDRAYNGGDFDAFVVRLNPTGSALAYGTFLGGGDSDWGYSIAVDTSGAAYVTGGTWSSDFPTTPGAYDTTGPYDAFVVKLNPSGSALAYGTFLGGDNSDSGYSIAVDASGAAYVTGLTLSSDFPTTPGAFDTTFHGYSDAFVVKLGLGTGLSISHIEVTQATQDENNSVPLIAGKPTFVRVYVDCGAGCASLPNVTGVLRGYGPSGELPGSPLSPTGFMRSITAYHESWQSQRGDLRKTLNFTLPPEWLTGTITLTAEISGTGYSEMVPFRQAQTVRVIYVPIRYKGRSPDPVRIHTGSSWALQVFPTSRINYVPGTTLDWDQCLKKSVLCPLWYHNSLNLLNRLTTMYRLVNAYVYGWLPEGTYNGGISDPTWNGGAGKAAFGDDHPSEGRRIFAHEIGHLLGRRHTNSVSCQSNRIDPRTDWPWVSSDSLIHEWGLDGYSFGWLVSSPSALKNPASTYDYMSYCGSLNDGNVWTSSWTYSHIFSETLRLQGAAQAIQAMTAITQPYFIASGLVYTDDTAIIDPIWVITPTEVPQNPPAGTQYCLEAQDAGGTVLSGHCFDLAFRDYETGEATGVDGFNLMLPYPSGVARIVLRKGAQQLAVRPVSAHAPTVAVLSPNGGEAWAATGTYTITWTASDADGDSLAYSVLYSPNGSDWLPVAAGITQTQVAVNAAELAGGNAARVRVLASDGVHTTADESDAPFTVARKAPQAFILSPERDIIIAPGTPLWLQGYAYDLEDGTLPDTALRWSSSRDGNLGTGEQVPASLSPGEHVITLTATDSDGNVTSATVRVYVGHKVYLPLVLRNR
jgi:hypothetical protein